MLRQKEFIDMSVLKAIDYLKENPFAGDMYAGELLEKLSETDTDSLTAYIGDIKIILSLAKEKNSEYEWLSDEERTEFAELINAFSKSLENK